MAGAEHQASVMYQTFGHLDAKLGEKHKGHFVFLSTASTAICALCIVNFSSFDEGPGYFSDRADFIWELVKKTTAHALRSGFTDLTANTRFLSAGMGEDFSGSVTCLQAF
uniref:hypothetical protein n=1 Tax=Escherichia coli TaxID=562 RepID=UPI001F17509A|nr:hypothetical protein [Escherichia coli]